MTALVMVTATVTTSKAAQSLKISERPKDHDLTIGGDGSIMCEKLLKLLRMDILSIGGISITASVKMEPYKKRHMDIGTIIMRLSKAFPKSSHDLT